MHFHKLSPYLKYFARENQTTREWVHIFLSLSKELCLVRMKEQVSSYLEWDSLLVTPQNISINLLYFIEFCVYIKNKTKQKHGKNIKTYHQDANVKQWPQHIQADGYRNALERLSFPFFLLYMYRIQKDALAFMRNINQRLLVLHACLNGNVIAWNYYCSHTFRAIWQTIPTAKSITVLLMCHVWCLWKSECIKKV